VNFNAGESTFRCVKSLDILNDTEDEIEVIVVNNGCVEKESLELPKRLKNVHFINSPQNLGFAGGNNLGINFALKNKADYVLLLNNDAYIKDKHFLEKLKKTNSDVVSPLIFFNKNGMETYDYGGRVDYIMGRNTHLESLSPKLIDSSRIDYFSGACLFIKRCVFDKVKHLDDKYFLYYEDVDYCLRVKKAGFRLKLCPGTQIFHDLSHSTSKLGKKKISILATSHLRFCRQHLPIISSPLYLLFNLYLRLKAI